AALFEKRREFISRDVLTNNSPNKISHSLHGYLWEPGAVEEKKKELLPAGWNANQEVYTLRYQSNDNQKDLLLKAVKVDSSLLINVMNPHFEQVVDLTVNLGDFIREEHLHEFDRVFKNEGQLRARIESGIIVPLVGGTNPKSKEGTQKGTKPSTSHPNTNPLYVRPRLPQGQPQWTDPMLPFATGGEDLDPFGNRRGGMIVDPLRSGFPRLGFDPSAGIPGQLPPGSVPPGARFDPFGPVEPDRSRPDPDHLPPPGYDDLFM
uniref:Proteasome inhibitor PI31 subunit n=1 Tax=Callorhinchus milii TaxID=7868 RepID=A0A4W3GPM7_CALMI